MVGKLAESAPNAVEGWTRTLGLVATILGAGITGASAFHSFVVAPLALRVEKLESNSFQEARDRAETLQRLRGVEEQVRANTQLLHRIESKLDHR
jgi:hypothetical protein